MSLAFLNTNSSYISLLEPQAHLFLVINTNMAHNSLVRSSLFDDTHGHNVVITRLMSC